MKKEIKIAGMHCAHCSARVEQALNGISGVKAKVDLEKGIATVKSRTEVSDSDIKQAVEALGFEVTD